MFPLRHFLRHAIKVLPSCRPMSSGQMVEVSDEEGIAVMTLQRPPVNSINLEFIHAISKSLDDVAKNKPRGMILTSALPTVFSAGFDIMEMYKPDPKRLEQFTTAHQEVWIKLFGFPFATAAAINGHAPAGGCLLAMSCEYRAMVSGKYTIGLNEAVLGIVAREWFIDSMRYLMGTREAELALTTGKLFTVDEAFQFGLIDDIASDKADAIEKCKNFIKKFDKILPIARTTSKLRLRQKTLEDMQKIRQQDIAETLEFIQDPEVQQSLETYIQTLKKKGVKKNLSSNSKSQ